MAIPYVALGWCVALVWGITGPADLGAVAFDIGLEVFNLVTL